MSGPSIAQLFLAFRQAKRTLFYERQGTGLHELAKYERNLHANLKTLQKVVGGGTSWFDRMDLGTIHLVPKRIELPPPLPNVIRTVGEPHAPAPMAVQVRLVPSPSFAVTEIMYLWEFGYVLDALVCQESLGYRLDKRPSAQGTSSHLFEHWPPKYQRFRTEPLEAAEAHLESPDASCIVISLDLANFYPSICSDFLLTPTFVAQAKARADANKKAFDETRYVAVTRSLLGAYARFRRRAKALLGCNVPLGIPIGALTSRLVANLALVGLDEFVIKNESVLAYRRYVDDIVIVADAVNIDARAQVDVLGLFVPLAQNAAPDANEVRLDGDALGRPGSDFRIQQRKLRIHRLQDVQGRAFVEAIRSDFGRLVSEHRAFLAPDILDDESLSRLVRTTVDGAPLRVLRDADKTKLERFSLSSAIASLEQTALMLDPNEARGRARPVLAQATRALEGEDNWVDHLGASLRLLALAVALDDDSSIRELLTFIDGRWGDVDVLERRHPELLWLGKSVTRKQAYLSLRDYLHALRLQAVLSTLASAGQPRDAWTALPALRDGPRSVAPKALMRRAKELASADLRFRPREYDALRPPPSATLDLERALKRTPQLASRLDTISRFVGACRALSDSTWDMPASTVYLSVRPPTYFDIARRWLYRVESRGFRQDDLQQLVEIVNATRGTNYKAPPGAVTGRGSVELLPSVHRGQQSDPRVILGNLVLKDGWFAAATRGRPVMSWERLVGLVTVLQAAEKAAGKPTGGSSNAILVLPELSLPRRWFSPLGNYIAKRGHLNLVVGLEYLHDPRGPWVHNQVYGLFPGGFHAAAAWPWTKQFPARHEGDELKKRRPPLAFRPQPKRKHHLVVQASFGRVAVVICSEVMEARRLGNLLGRVDLLLAPSWNQDTTAYDQVIHAVALQLHAIVAIANNGHYSDCRIAAPRRRWAKDVCRLVERDINSIVFADVPISELRAIHAGGPPNGDWRPLPPDFP